MKYLRLLCVFGLILVMDIRCLQAAAGHADFSGTWTVDLNAPETTSMDAILEAYGIPWAYRKVMATMDMTQVITQTEKSITFRIETSIGIESITLSLNGNNEIVDMDKSLGKVVFRTLWEQNGKVLVCIGKFKNREGRKLEWTNRRHLKENGGTMIVDNILLRDDGQKLTGKRVLRKQ
jgi:hypothetical protein